MKSKIESCERQTGFVELLEIGNLAAVEVA